MELTGIGAVALVDEADDISLSLVVLGKVSQKVLYILIDISILARITVLALWSCLMTSTTSIRLP